jgi:hypothetical protein
VDQTEIIDAGIKPAARNISFHCSGYTTGMTVVRYHSSGYTIGMTVVRYHSSGYSIGMTEVATENSLSKQRLHYRHDGSCRGVFAFKTAATL